MHKIKIMLGIFLIYWIGKKYYNLATQHGRSPWGFAILAVAIYYGIQLILGIILAITIPDIMADLDSSTEMMLNIIGVPISLGGWYLVLIYLRRKWEKEADTKLDDYETQIEQIGKEE